MNNQCIVDYSNDQGAFGVAWYLKIRLDAVHYNRLEPYSAAVEVTFGKTMHMGDIHYYRLEPCSIDQQDYLQHMWILPRSRSRMPVD